MLICHKDYKSLFGCNNTGLQIAFPPCLAQLRSIIISPSACPLNGEVYLSNSGKSMREEIEDEAIQGRRRKLQSPR